MVTGQRMQEPGNSGRRQREIAGDPGRGACGIVALAELAGGASHHLVELALSALTRMEHRGGAIGATGDGAGVLLRPERDFFARFITPGRSLASPDEPLIVGTIAFLPGERNVHQFQREVDAILRRSGLAPMGWRKVPVCLEVLDTRARRDAPLLYQMLCAKGHRLESHLPRLLFQAKGQLEERLGGAITVTSLAPYTTIYKALTDAHALPRFFPDLADPALTTRLILGHRRFATNTFSSWHLAQPFQLLAHNGEINTITANCRAVRDVDSAIEMGCQLMRHGSDSAHVDRVVEMMAVSGMSNIAEALRRIMPPSWEESCDPVGPSASPTAGSSGAGGDAERDRQRQFFAANRRAMGTLGAWEGPAAIAASDGRLLVGLLDRMGLRPLRYLETHDRRVIIASEMGAVPVAPDQIARDGQLEPGEMVIADLDAGELILPDRSNSWILARTGLNFGGLATEDILPVATLSVHKDLSVTALNKFGWTKERIQRLRHMVKQSSPLVHSMGNDLPLAIFSENHSRLYSFFNQIVAVITNPPIDPLREGGAMDTTVFLGRSPRVTRHANYISWPQYQLEHPVVTNQQVAALVAEAREDLTARRVDATMAPTEEPWDLALRIDELADEAVELVRDGVSILVISDVAALDSERLPLPMLLVVGALHRALANFGLRRDASVVVETAEVHEGHDLAVLVAYGATAVNPYAMFQAAGDVSGITTEEAHGNLVTALVEDLRRIMSKMGITSLAGYRGSALFEAIGVSSAVVEYFIPDTVSRLGGLELDDIYRDMVARADQASGLKRNQNVPIYRKEVTTALQLVARNGNRDGDYDRFVALLDATPPVYLRDLLDLRSSDPPRPIDQVVDAAEVIRTTLRGAAMSHGALHAAAHRAIAAAFNHYGSRSNSGEGGEDERRNPSGPWAADRNRTRQVASGRFGVDAGYLVGADEIEIKIGQGAKPGEGGHLPAAKVTAEIARIRKVAAGVTLISPPPHHDIYSIEDIAQLILHLREVNPAATIAVKVPSITNLGTIAVGIVKAGADTIAISGFEGGTGAAYVGSILHAGLPVDRGISEAHQYLVVNGIRDRVRLRADGGLKRGLDVAKIMALGADEVAFGTSLMVAENCVYCRGCSGGKCPAGLATQDEGLQARFMRRHHEDRIGAETSMDDRYQEARAGVIRYLECVAEDLRSILAGLGLRHPAELVGRTDLLAQRRTGNPRWDRLDLTELTTPVEVPTAPPAGRSARSGPLDHNQRIVAAAAPVLSGEVDRIVIDIAVDTDAHGLGATLAGLLAKTPAATDRTVEIRSHGYAGQGLGFAATSGMVVHHQGYANDTVAEVMSGTARVVVVPPAPDRVAHLIGNAAAYGATGGSLLVAGTAGQRFGVRNSGATLVCHGVGKYAFEYMTGGIGVVLGDCGPVVGSGMTGGQLFLWRHLRDPASRLHDDVMGSALVASSEPATALREILTGFAAATDSPVARAILADWPAAAGDFLHVTPAHR